MDRCRKKTLLSLNYIHVVFSAFFLSYACSAEDKHTAGKQINDPLPSIGVGGTAEGYAIDVNSEQLTCEPRGQEHPCYCPDGTENGTQLCGADGELLECSGCITDLAPEINTEGKLCPQIANKAGCIPESYVSQELPSSILFVVDRSGSMACNTPAAGQSSEECEEKSERMFDEKPSKWEITIEALKKVFENMDESGARAGLMFFSNDGRCGVHSDLTLGGVPLDLIDASHINLLSNALDHQIPNGGTPLVGATVLAYNHLHEEAGGECKSPPCGAPGNRYVVLITDGVDSCPNPRFEQGGAPCGDAIGPCTHYLLNTEVPNAVEVNIKTFVIGAPGSELGRGFLSELAFQGGTAWISGLDCAHGDLDGTTGNCHFDMTQSEDFAGDLSEALRKISGATLGCEFSVPNVTDETIDMNKVNVQYTLPGKDPVCVFQDETKPCEQGANGWQFAKNPDGSQDLSKVVLCGEACNIVERNSRIQVDVILGCEVIIVE